MNYLIYGEEPFLIKRKIDDLINTYIDDINDMNIATYDFSNDSIETVISDCNTIPFFSECKVVLLKNADFLTSNGKIDENSERMLLEYISKNNESTVFIMIVNSFIDKRKKLVKQIEKYCKVFKYQKLENKDLTDFIKNELNRKKVIIERDALNYFINIEGNDLYKIVNDIEKLSIHGGNITKDIISSLINRTIEDDIWKFTNSIYARDGKTCFKSYEDMKQMSTEPLALIGLIASQFRFLFQVRTLADLGFSSEKIADELGANPYRVKMNFNVALQYDVKEIMKVLNDLSELDQNIKKGLIDKNLGFELFLVNRCKN